LGVIFYEIVSKKRTVSKATYKTHRVYGADPVV